MNKYSFKISWLAKEEAFLVKLLCDGEEVEQYKTISHLHVFDYISDTMCNLQIAGEDWTLSY